MFKVSLILIDFCRPLKRVPWEKSHFELPRSKIMTASPQENKSDFNFENQETSDSFNSSEEKTISWASILEEC